MTQVLKSEANPAFIFPTKIKPNYQRKKMSWIGRQKCSLLYCNLCPENFLVQLRSVVTPYTHVVGIVLSCQYSENSVHYAFSERN